MIQYALIHSNYVVLFKSFSSGKFIVKKILLHCISRVNCSTVHYQNYTFHGVPQSEWLNTWSKCFKMEIYERFCHFYVKHGSFHLYSWHCARHEKLESSDSVFIYMQSDVGQNLGLFHLYKINIFASTRGIFWFPLNKRQPIWVLPYKVFRIVNIWK